MIAVDTNILVYAHRIESPWHAPAAVAVRDLAEDTAPWAIPWPCIHEFIGVVTNPRVFRTPTPLERALDDIEVWMESPSLRVIGESGAYWPHLREALVRGSVVGAVVHDARIAAICKSHGVTALLTADRDFSRFPTVAVRNPLIR